MVIAVEPKLELWVDTLVREGRYPNAEAVVSQGLRLLGEYEAKLAALRAMIDASIARGGDNSDNDVAAAVEERLTQLHHVGE